MKREHVPSNQKSPVGAVGEGVGQRLSTLSAGTERRAEARRAWDVYRHTKIPCLFFPKHWGGTGGEVNSPR